MCNQGDLIDTADASNPAPVQDSEMSVASISFKGSD